MRLPLLGGAYLNPGLIASAQRCVNLYPEANPEESQAPVPVTHYPRPGLTPLGAPDTPGFGRCAYTATNGDLYLVVDQTVYYVDQNWTFTAIGTLLSSPGRGPIIMADNGVTIIAVDGQTGGYYIDMATRALTTIGDPNFLGGTRVDFLDGYLSLNQPNTPNWYCTESYSSSFNALFVGIKTAWPDDIQTIIAVAREMLLLGKFKSEIWTPAGTVPFPFQIIPGLMVEYGCVAPFSAQKQDNRAYWLSQSPEGSRMAMMLEGHQARRISTHALEAEWLTYARVDDAIGAVYQLRGHNFYKLHFPTADRTWGYDAATRQWHEDAWFDVNGVQHRARNTFCAFAYGTNVGQDWATGQLYKIDERNFTDNENYLVCIRSMPHLLDNENFDRVTYWKLIADIETGTGSGTVNVQTTGSPWSMGFSSGFGPTTYITPPLISLRMSRTRGNSWGNKMFRPMGAAGLYETTPTWNRLGRARGVVFEVSWSTPMQTALNGVFVEFEKHEADT